MNSCFSNQLKFKPVIQSECIWDISIMSILSLNLYLMSPDNWFKDSLLKIQIQTIKTLSVTITKNAGQKIVEWDSWNMMSILEEQFSGKLRTDYLAVSPQFTGKIPSYQFIPKTIQTYFSPWLDFKLESYLKLELSKNNLHLKRVFGSCKTKLQNKSLPTHLLELMMIPSKDLKTEFVKF